MSEENTEGLSKLREYLYDLSRSEKASFPRRCGSSLASLRRAIYRNNTQIDAKVAVAIERESKGAIRAEDLRPDIDWAVIRGTGAEQAPIGTIRVTPDASFLLGDERTVTFEVEEAR